MTLAELNMDLCRALGIRDPEKVHSVDLQIRAGRLPLLIVERHVMSADGLQTAVEMLDLKTQAHASDADQLVALLKAAEARA